MISARDSLGQDRISSPQCRARIVRPALAPGRYRADDADLARINISHQVPTGRFRVAGRSSSGDLLRCARAPLVSQAWPAVAHTRFAEWEIDPSAWFELPSSGTIGFGNFRRCSIGQLAELDSGPNSEGFRSGRATNIAHLLPIKMSETRSRCAQVVMTFTGDISAI